MSQNFERLPMTHNKELQLIEEDQRTNHEKMIDVCRRLTETIDKLIAKRNKKAKTGT